MLVNEPGHYTIHMSQGGSFSLMFTWKDSNGDLVDLTSCSGKLPIFKKIKIPTAPFESLELAYTFETSPGSGMTLGDSAGTILLEATADDTAGFEWEDAVYDLYITFTGGDVTRLLDGHVVLAARLGG